MISVQHVGIPPSPHPLPTLCAPTIGIARQDARLRQFESSTKYTVEQPSCPYITPPLRASSVAFASIRELSVTCASITAASLSYALTTVPLCPPAVAPCVASRRPAPPVSSSSSHRLYKLKLDFQPPTMPKPGSLTPTSTRPGYVRVDEFCPTS